jgi:hypothetical protein
MCVQQVCVHVFGLHIHSNDAYPSTCTPPLWHILLNDDAYNCLIVMNFYALDKGALNDDVYNCVLLCHFILDDDAYNSVLLVMYVCLDKKCFD